MGRFHVTQSFAIESRSLFAMSGSVAEGVVQPGMSVCLKLNSQLWLSDVIHSTEVIPREGGGTDLCVCIKSDDPDELALWSAMNIAGEDVLVVGPRGTRRTEMEQGCRFYVEILAPTGLAGVEKHLAQCKMDLVPRRSTINGQVILHAQLGEDRFEFAMDPSTSDTLVASGEIYMPAEAAWELLRSLSDVLKRAGFPHLVGMDDPLQTESRWIRDEWLGK